jgi:hypothetical protein
MPFAFPSESVFAFAGIRSRPMRRCRKALLASKPSSACYKCRAAVVGSPPLNLYAAKIESLSIREDQPDSFILRVRNVGKQTWAKDTPIFLGTARPRDRVSPCYHKSWKSLNRICGKAEAIVPQGSVATFCFQMNLTGNSNHEGFQILVDGEAWLPGTEFVLNPAQLAATSPVDR